MRVSDARGSRLSDARRIGLPLTRAVRSFANGDTPPGPSHFRAAVERASRQVATQGVGREELVWRLLSALQITELRLEGVDQADRTAAVGLGNAELALMGLGQDQPDCGRIDFGAGSAPSPTSIRRVGTSYVIRNT